ncbi:MAG: vitamin B12-dependent ribonucleotide reductase [Deferribacteraceae bacterium]|jgi:ribonucleoside-diphosphate reductase alpha chain|nr:vitamin B12-dependent ribonucleotide reductase [Deferribacteraceae bacterium]
MSRNRFTKEPALNPNASTVLQKRYLLKDDSGMIRETPKELFIRVAENIALAEKIFDPNADAAKYAEDFYNEMTEMNFLPNSPTLMNAGSELQQLSACFVLPVEDSLDGIFNAVKYTAMIHKSGGGTGFSFSRLRPKDDVVKTTKGVSSGPVSFMSVFDAATETIKQGGARRGANMGILRVDHPDIMDFIHSKKDKSKLTNFNISVGITEEFMKAVKDNREYNLYNPKNKAKTSSISAAKVYNEMVQLAWEGGDPGIIFLDRINRDNPTPAEGEIESTNPCGEQPLLPYESCNLGSVNLANFVKGRDADWDKLRKTVRTAVRFLDNVIEMNNYPIPEIESMTRKNRKIGLGVMGWADMLVMLEIPYNSGKAASFAEKIMQFIRDEGRLASAELAVKRGNFPGFDASVYPELGFKNMRNATITTIAPTGTISIIGGASSGIEPFFALAFYRNVMDNNKLTEVNPLFLNVSKREGFYSEKLLNAIAENGCISDSDDVPARWKDIFVTAHEITPEWHVKMQAAFQKYTDNAVSKTVNFSENATVDDVRSVYDLSYEQGCKGVTIYRDGSRSGQVINVGIKGSETANAGAAVPLLTESYAPRPRPDMLIGKTIEMVTGCGKMYVTINQDEKGRIFEVFIHIGKAGGCAQSQSEAIGRLISLALRSGSEPELIIRQLKSISCHKKSGFGPNAVMSCADAAARALERAISTPIEFTTIVTKPLSVETFIEEYEKKSAIAGKKKVNIGACPECEGPIEYIEGCNMCYSCGYSHCS